MPKASKLSATGSATSLPSCASCGCDVGKEAGKIPFFVDDSATGGGTHEPFCARCFVYVRSPREPQRFRPGTFIPLKCCKCGLESVGVGLPACIQCRSVHVIVLPPEPGVC